jgi:hypothetical protein
MLEIRPTRENCNKTLPNETTEAMICTFECTFCEDCVKNVLKNVCPNCGGGEKRPVRPANCATKICVTNYPVSGLIKHRPVNWEKYSVIQDIFINTSPHKK